MAAEDPTEASPDLAEHQATYNGFLMLLRISAAVSLIILVLLYFFLANSSPPLGISSDEQRGFDEANQRRRAMRD